MSKMRAILRYRISATARLNVRFSGGDFFRSLTLIRYPRRMSRVIWNKGSSGAGSDQALNRRAFRSVRNAIMIMEAKKQEIDLVKIT